MILPSTEEIADKIEKANPVDINEVRTFILKSMAAGMKDQLLEIYKTNDVKGPYKPDREGKSRRAIRNTALSYLGKIAENDSELKKLLSTSFKESSNMTDQMAALGAICSAPGEDRNNALQAFYTQWTDEPLVLLKW